MKVELTSVVDDGELVIEKATRDCYNSIDKMPEGGSMLVKGCVKKGHKSILGHSSASFRITGVSRACMSQITRHRMAAFSVKSQRYVNHGIIPKKTLDKAYFDIIDNKTKAYILGWIFSDGNIYVNKDSGHYTMSIKLKSSDSYILNAFKYIVGVKANLFEYTDEGTTKLHLSCKEMINTLINKYGIIPNKSLSMNGKLAFKNIPKEFHKSFLLGLFDGDGTVGVAKRSESDVFAGIYSFSPEFLQDLKDNFDIFKDRNTTQNKVIFQGKFKVAEFLDYLYSDIDFGKDLYLLRKFSKSLEISDIFYNKYKHKIDNDLFVIPENIRENKKALSLYMNISRLSFYNYTTLIGLGVHREDARNILPNSSTTVINMSMNYESLLNFFKLRLDKHAQEEVREVAHLMWDLIKPYAPKVFNVDTLLSYTIPDIDESRL